MKIKLGLVLLLLAVLVGCGACHAGRGAWKGFPWKMFPWKSPAKAGTPKS